MQVPERLALIGGSVLLSSILIFGLKGQASQILPKVTHPIASISDSTNDIHAQYGNSFERQWYQNKEQGLPSGNWGTAKYYIDKSNNMYVGAGQLQGNIQNTIGSTNATKLKAVNITQLVKAPSDSSSLLANLSQVTNINGTDNIDTSQAGNIGSIFSNDSQLKSLDLNNWDVRNVGIAQLAFNDDSSLTDLKISNWNLQNSYWNGWMLFNTSSLTHLDLSHWNMSNKYLASLLAQNNSLQSLDLSNLDTTGSTTGGMLITDNALSQITLGPNTKVPNNNINLTEANWKNGDQILNSSQLMDGNSHPGTWVKQ